MLIVRWHENALKSASGQNLKFNPAKSEPLPIYAGLFGYDSPLPTPDSQISGCAAGANRAPFAKGRGGKGGGG